MSASLTRTLGALAIGAWFGTVGEKARAGAEAAGVRRRVSTADGRRRWLGCRRQALILGAYAPTHRGTRRMVHRVGPAPTGGRKTGIPIRCSPGETATTASLRFGGGIKLTPTGDNWSDERSWSARRHQHLARAAAMPTRRAGIAAEVGGKIYVIGGAAITRIRRKDVSRRRQRIGRWDHEVYDPETTGGVEDAVKSPRNHVRERP